MRSRVTARAEQKPLQRKLLIVASLCFGLLGGAAWSLSQATTVLEFSQVVVEGG